MALAGPALTVDRSSRARTAAHVLLLAAAYAGIVRLGSLATTLPGGISPIFPSAGIALAAALIMGRPALLGVWLGSVTANTLAFGWFTDGRLDPSKVLVSFAIGAGVALAAWAGAQLVRALGRGEPPLATARNVLVLVGAGALASAVTSATAGLLTLWLAGIVPPGAIGYAWLTWILGDAFGIVLAAPLLLALHRRPPGHQRPRRPVEATALAALTLLLGRLVFFRNVPFEYGFLPLLAWAAFRFGLRGTSIAAAIVAALAAVGTSQGTSPFAHGTANDALLALDSFLGVTVVFALVLAGVLAEREQADDERVRLQAQLVQAQKMEAIGRLAGGVAHDFNNLLTVIINNCALTLEEPGLPVEARESVEVVREAGESAASLTRQLLAFSRKQVLRPVSLDLNELVHRTERMLRRIIGEDVVLEIRPGAGVWPIQADPGQMEQVIVNLAVNSRDSMPRGGQLLVETGNVVLDEEYARAHPGVVPGEYAMLAVTDSGVGMDAATLGHIFEPFYSTKGSLGTGLGLSTVHGIVSQSRGHVWPTSEPGRGTTFRVYLPRWAGEGGAVEEAPAPILAASRGETVLVVEDSPAVRSLVVRLLTDRGHRVLQAAGGEEAAAVAARHAGPIALLVTDVVMPGLDGPALAARLVVERPGLAVLYMSGYAAGGIAGEGGGGSAADFIAKPFTLEAMAHKVAEVLQRRAPAPPAA